MLSSGCGIRPLPKTSVLGRVYVLEQLSRIKVERPSHIDKLHHVEAALPNLVARYELLVTIQTLSERMLA